MVGGNFSDCWGKFPRALADGISLGWKVRAAKWPLRITNPAGARRQQSHILDCGKFPISKRVGKNTLQGMLNQHLMIKNRWHIGCRDFQLKGKTGKGCNENPICI